MAITPLPALDRTTATFKADVDTFFGSQLPTFSIEAEAARADMVIKQGQAATSATNAATSEGNALTSKNAAAISKTGADTARNAAQVAQAAAELALDSFDDRYLGAKAEEPALDNDGAALLTGTLYWNSTSTKLRLYSAGAWIDAAISYISPAFTGLPTAPTAAPGTNTTQLATTAHALAAAALRYGKNNILGAVSQSGGVPTGAIIERGSNANGEYVRFADGTQIRTHSRLVNVVTAAGAAIAVAYTPPAASVGESFASYSVTFYTGGGYTGAKLYALHFAVAGELGLALNTGVSASEAAPRSTSLGTYAAGSHYIAITEIGRWF